MYECNYSREPVNYRLLVLRLLKKWWLIPVSMICGSVIVFSIYFFVKTVIYGRTYLAENKYYIDFAEDSAGNQYTWVNQYTWSELADMNVFIDGIYADLNGEVPKDVIRSSSDCTVESDGRYLYMRIITNDPDLSLKIADSYEKTLFAFCDEHKEFNSIKCEHRGDVVENTNIRTRELLIIGALAGLFVAAIFVLVREVVDTSIYIPATLEYRYHIPTLLSPSMAEFEINVKKMIGEPAGLALIFVDNVSEDECERVKSALGVKSFTFVNPCLKPEMFDEIASMDKKVLCVKAASNNGKMIERTVEELGRLSIGVDCIMLTNEDASLLKKYYKQ